MLYKILNSHHLQYDPDKIQKACLLYDGGYEIMEHASMLLTKLSIESQQSYNERLKCAAYMPYLSQFVDHFASSLFADDLIVRQAADADDTSTLGGPVESESFYKVFAADCDGQRNSFHNFMKDTFTEALYADCAIVGLDFRRSQEEPSNLLEEELMGLDRAFLYDIDPLTVIDWKCHEDNFKFQWVKLRHEIILQDDPLQPAKKQVEFKVWTMRNGVAHWDLYRSEAIEMQQQFMDSDDIPLTDSGDTSFKEIPILYLHIPPGLHLGNKLGPVCEEYFQRRSFLVSNMNKTCIAIPVVKLGSEISAPGEALPSQVQQDPNRAQLLRMQLSNKGYVVIGQDDELEIKEATGSSHALVDKQLIDLREQMHQVVHQMAQSIGRNATQMGRSAASKGEDRHATEILLTAYSRCVKDFCKEVYQCLASARGESVVWAVEGLSTFVEEDRGTIIEEVKAVAGKESILNLIPSETARKKYLLRLATAMVGTVSPEEMATIQDEIETGLPEMDQRKKQAEQEQQQAKPEGAKPSQGQDQQAAANDPPTLGPSGNTQLNPGSHLATGEHTDWHTVYNMLLKDYKPEHLAWVKVASWRGPVEVDANDISFVGEENWKANKPGPQGTEKVDEFVKVLSDKGFTTLNPIILANMPHNNEKLTIIDGRHRAKAAQQTGVPILAYIADVGSVDADTPHMNMHSNQIERTS